jgi:hypothetical protein
LPSQLGLALRQVAALQFWQGYAALDAAYRSWKSDAGAALLSRGSDGPDGGGASLRVDLGNSFEVAVARGEALAGRLLRLAAEDRLGVLVAPGDDAAAGGEDPARVRLLVVAAGGEAGADEYRSAVVRGAWGGTKGWGGGPLRSGRRAAAAPREGVAGWRGAALVSPADAARSRHPAPIRSEGRVVRVPHPCLREQARGWTPLKPTLQHTPR